MHSSVWMNSECSSATAVSTAPIRSASGGSGMYSLAPALIARTAAWVSLPTPQATTGTAMRSDARLEIKVARSSWTSANTKSAPRPERKKSSPASMVSTWLTLAPRLIAIWLAAPTCPSKVPMMSKRINWDSSIKILNALSWREDAVEHHFQPTRVFLTTNGRRTHNIDIVDHRFCSRIAIKL